MDDLVNAKNTTALLVFGLRGLQKEGLAHSVENMLVQALPRYGRMVLNGKLEKCEQALRQDTLQRCGEDAGVAKLLAGCGLEKAHLVKSTLVLAEQAEEYMLQLIRFTGVGRVPSRQVFSCVRLLFEEATALYCAMAGRVKGIQAVLLYLNHKYWTQYLSYLLAQLPQ